MLTVYGLLLVVDSAASWFNILRTACTDHGEAAPHARFCSDVSLLLHENATKLCRASVSTTSSTVKFSMYSQYTSRTSNLSVQRAFPNWKLVKFLGCEERIISLFTSSFTSSVVYVSSKWYANGLYLFETLCLVFCYIHFSFTGSHAVRAAAYRPVYEIWPKSKMHLVNGVTAACSSEFERRIKINYETRYKNPTAATSSLLEVGLNVQKRGFFCSQ